MKHESSLLDMPGILLIAALVFLLGVPDRVPFIVTTYLELSAFALSLFITWRFFAYKRYGFGILFFMIALLYNPYMLLLGNSWFGMDIMTALLCFLAALYISAHSKKN